MTRGGGQAVSIASRQVVVERPETPVMFKRVADEVTAIGRGSSCTDRDPSRPGIEFYRRRDVIDLLLPIV
jgi:hypothetical protein